MFMMVYIVLKCWPGNWFCGVVVITSALHAEGLRFDPGRNLPFFQSFFQFHLLPIVTFH